MSGTSNAADAPDLTQGVEVSQIADGGMLLGQVRGEPVLLARRGAEQIGRAHV